MIKKSIVSSGLLLVAGACSFAACTSSDPDGGGTGGGSGSGTGGTTGGAGGTTGGAGGTTGGVGTGGSTGGMGPGGSTGGTGGSTGGVGTGGTTGGVGTGGTSNPVGGGGGTPPVTGGTGGQDPGAGGMNTAGTGMGGTGVGGGGTGNDGPVTVQLAQERQEMAGFGINNTWAPAMSDSEADALFSTTNGLGFSILRVGLGDNGSHMSDNIPGDITKAKARGVQYIIGSCWSPPGNMKTNGQVNDGGHVKPENYETWATTIAKYASDNDLYAMSIGNEPDFASCGSSEPCNGNYPTTLYTAEEMVAFVKVAGPKLKAAGVKVIAPEASEWLHNWSNNSATGSEPGNKNSSDPLKCGFPGTMCAAGKGYDYGHALFADKTAWAAFDIMGVHQYDTQVAEPWPADVTEKKPVWQTEMSGVKWWKEQGPSATIENGVAVAEWIHSAVTIGEASAWLWWWYRANNTDDNEGLLLKSGADTKRHYTVMNYSRFIRPGYKSVAITGAAPDGVLLSGFKGTDGTVVIVAINKGAASADVPITIAGTAPAMLTPWVTSSTLDFKSQTAVAVTGGMFTATLASKTVTTFVGK